MNLSIFEKLSVLFELITNSSFTVISFLLALFIFVSLMVTLYIEKKSLKLIFPVIYVLFIALLTINYYDDLIKGFGLFVDDLFFKTYFPSIALYFTILFVNALGLFLAMFSKKVTKYSKMVTIGAFSCLQFLFALLFQVTASNNLSLSDWSSLYQNREILSILEVSMGVFLIWLFLLFIGFGLHMINKYGEEKEDIVTISMSTWQEFQNSIKNNIVRLTQEMELTKKKNELDKMQTLQRLNLFEEALIRSNNYFANELARVANQVNHRELYNHVLRLQQIITATYQYTAKEIEILKRGQVDGTMLEKRMQQFEMALLQLHDEFENEVKVLRNRPESEVQFLKDKIDMLEFSLKQYVCDIKRQIEKTRLIASTTNNSQKQNQNYKRIN